MEQVKCWNITWIGFSFKRKAAVGKCWIPTHHSSKLLHWCCLYFFTVVSFPSCPHTNTHFNISTILLSNKMMILLSKAFFECSNRVETINLSDKKTRWKPGENTNRADGSLLEGITHKPCVVPMVTGEHKLREGGPVSLSTHRGTSMLDKASCPLHRAGYFSRHPAAVSSTV